MERQVNQLLNFIFEFQVSFKSRELKIHFKSHAGESFLVNSNVTKSNKLLQTTNPRQNFKNFIDLNISIHENT